MNQYFMAGNPKCMAGLFQLLGPGEIVNFWLRDVRLMVSLVADDNYDVYITSRLDEPGDRPAAAQGFIVGMGRHHDGPLHAIQRSNLSVLCHPMILSVPYVRLAKY